MSSSVNVSNSKQRRRLLFIFQNGRCDCCGFPMNINESTFEHIIPRSLRNVHDSHKLVLTCYECNQGRGGDIKYLRLSELKELSE